MIRFSAVYIAIFLTMFTIDMIWLRVIAIGWYTQGMGPLLSESPNLWAAAAFYLIFPVGILIFAVLPNEAGGILKVALMGALFGFFAYSTYDLTNLAVVKNWPVGLTFLDIAWGTLVSGVSATAGKLTFDYVNR